MSAQADARSDTEQSLIMCTNTQSGPDCVGDSEKADSEQEKSANLLSLSGTPLPSDESSSSRFAQSVTLTSEDEGCRFTKPATFLFFLCLLVIAQSCVVIGYSSSIQTSLQKQFGFTTNQYGVIVSSFEYTSIPSVVVISFFGHRRNRARLIGYGSLLISIGCGMYVLPFVFSLRNGASYSVASRLHLPLEEGYQNSSRLPTDANSHLCSANGAEVNWYIQSNESEVMRSVGQEEHQSAPCESASVDAAFSSAMFGMLVGAQMMLGLGSSPIYTLGPTYLYDAVCKTRYAALISLVYAGTALGPALGFLMGALCLTVYITPWRPPPTSQADFVGAWWIGLLVCAAVALAAGLPLLLFPKRLRPIGAAQHLQELPAEPSNVESHSTLASDSDSVSRRSTVTIIGKCDEWRHEQLDEPPAHAGFGNKRSCTQIGPGLKRLFASRIWLSVSLCLIAENSIVTGFVTYLAKYLQTVFYVATNYASVIAGVILIPAAVTGFLAGGVITQRVLVDTRRTALYLMVVSIATLALLVPLGFLHCEYPRLAGVTVGYPQQSASGPLYDTLSSLAVSLQLAAAGVGVGVGVTRDEATRTESNYSLYSACSASCGCSTQQYAPICAEVRGVKISFYSACFAGCSLASNYSYAAQAESVNLFYYNCSCVPASFVHGNSSAIRTGWSNDSWEAVTLSDGPCESTCALIAPFLAVMFVIIFLVSSAQNAALMLTLQSAAPDDRSFALGVQNFFIRLVAFIPTPIYFGALFDSWCILWSAPAARGRCEDAAPSARYCLLTDIVALPYVVVGCAVLLKLLSVAACICCWLSARSRSDLDVSGAQSACASACASIVSSAPSCLSDLPTVSATVRYSARQFENAAVAYRSKRLLPPQSRCHELELEQQQQQQQQQQSQEAVPTVTLVPSRSHTQCS